MPFDEMTTLDQLVVVVRAILVYGFLFYLVFIYGPGLLKKKEKNDGCR